jgi:hypothetical protein
VFLPEQVEGVVNEAGEVAEVIVGMSVNAAQNIRTRGVSTI